MKGIVILNYLSLYLINNHFQPFLLFLSADIILLRGFR